MCTVSRVFFLTPFSHGDGPLFFAINPKANAEYLMEELDAAVATIREGLKKDAKFSELTKLLLMVKAGKKKKAASTRDNVKAEEKNSATMGSAENVNVLTAAFSKKITDAFEKVRSKPLYLRFIIQPVLTRLPCSSENRSTTVFFVLTTYPLLLPPNKGYF